MFTPDNRTVIPEPTPERVYQLVIYLQRQKSIKREDLLKAMTMPDVYGDNRDVFNHTFGVARELNLLVESDGQVVSTEALNNIQNVADFRRYCARIVFQWEDSLFSQVTSFYCTNAEGLRSAQGIDDIVAFLGRAGFSIHDNVIKGWRLWAPFLGCGYLQGNVLIPNWQQRIADLLQDQIDLPRRKEISIDVFIKWLKLKAPEVRGSISGNHIGLAVTNGLKTLDALGILKVITTPDAVQWQLVPTYGASTVSHVMIMR